jgi:hypothetical protein
MTKTYGKNAIYALLKFDWENLDDWLEVRNDGIWVLAPDPNHMLTPEEVAARTPHPKRDLDQPALPLPSFTLQEFLEFEATCQVVRDLWVWGEAPLPPECELGMVATPCRDEIERLERVSAPAAELLRALLGEDARQQATDELPPQERPLKREAQHREDILNALRARDIDPLKLPTYQNGRPDPSKQAAKACLVPKKMSDAAFEKAWSVLSKSREIRRAGA